MKKIILIFVSIFSIVFASKATTYTVTSNANAGAGTLREAIQLASAAVGPHTIIFNAAMTITIDSDLSFDAVNHNNITINGFVDLVNGPDVIIKSSGTLNNKMVFNSTIGASIYGLVFQNLEFGIHLNKAKTCVIKGCYFGTNAAGTAIATGIYQSGVFIEDAGINSNNIVGGLLSNLSQGVASNPLLNNSERCIFAGCSQKTDVPGTRIPALKVVNSDGTLIVGNYFGVDVTGLIRLGNGNQITKLPLAHSNIYMNNAKLSIIDRNVIAATTGSGIHLENKCDNTKIKGNKIGTNATGTAAYNAVNVLSFSNEASGIFIQGGSDMVIGYDGGVIANERNIISGNGGAKHNNWQQTCDGGFSDYNQFGIYSESLDNSIIKGNYVGTDITGNSSGIGNVFGNRAGGIKMVTVNGVGNSHSQNNIVGGGSTANDRNIISGNGYLWKANDNTSACGAPNPSNMVGGPGLLLQYAKTASNTISGNYVGLGANGTTPLGNNANGIEIQGAASNNIGTAGVPNYVCNNTWGIFLQVDFGSPFVPAANNTIEGNVVGLTPTNTILGNGVRAGLTEGGGIGMQMGVTGNKIGTAVANGGNVVSGNRIGIGIETNSVTTGATAPTGNIIYNNIIGLDPTGAISKPNTENGISIGMGSQGTIFPFGNTIGGTGANQANIISSNQKSGIYISNTTAITPTTANNIVGNKIGTNLAGTADLGNTLQGIEINNVNKTTIATNLISGNEQNGISLTGSSTNTIQDNIIGTNVGKTAPIPNGLNGVFLAGSLSNTILSNAINTNKTNGIALTSTSSSNIIQGNTINSNTENGISIVGASASNIIGGAAGDANIINTNALNGILVTGAGTINNSIHKNSFSCNLGRGIVLSSGGNAGYAAPTINGTPTQIIWTGPAVGSIIEVFETDGCATCATDPTRLQGKKLINSGASPYTFNIAAGFDKNKTYTATASVGVSGAHNTSEFSACYSLCENPSSVTITGTPLTFCEGGSVTLTAKIVGGTGGTPTYEWSKNNVVVGGNTATLDVTTSGSYTLKYTSTTTCGPTTSVAAVVTVNPRPVIKSAATDVVCSGVAQNYTITSDIPSSYSWSRAPVNGVTNAAVTNSSSNPITEKLLNTTTSAIVVEYLITPTSTTGTCVSVAPFSYKVTVNPESIIANQTPLPICSETAFSVIPTGVPTGTTYTWSTPVVTGSVSGALAESTAQTSIEQTLKNNGSTAATVVYTVTPKSGTCNGANFKVTVTVNPSPKINSDDTNVLCSEEIQNYLIKSDVASTYTWSRALITNIDNAAVTNSTINPITEALINKTTAPIVVEYLIKATSTVGACPAASTFSYKVTVNPKPTINSEKSNTVCSEEVQNYLIKSDIASTYTWSRASVPNINNAAVTNSSVNPIIEALVNASTAPINVVYIINAKSTAGTCSNATPFTYTVTVNPKPSIINATATPICSGGTFSVNPTNVPVGTTYSWSIPTGTGFKGGSAQTDQTSISQTLENTGNADATATYTVTPKSGTCPGKPFTVTVLVKPQPAVKDQTPDPICSGETFTVTPTGVPAGTTYTWLTPTGADIIGGSAQPVGQPNISQTLSNNSNAVATATYEVTPSSSSCGNTTFRVIVKVNPKPVITSLSSDSVCSESVNQYKIESNVNSDFTWTRETVIGIENAAGVGTTNPISEVLTNSTKAPIVVVYKINLKYSGTQCAGDEFTYSVKVNPKPIVVITAAKDTAICSTDSVSFTADADGYTTGSYEWFDGSSSLGNDNPLKVKLAGSYSVVYTTLSKCASESSAPVVVKINADNSPAILGKDFATCLDTAYLVGNIPEFGVGTWTVLAPTSVAISAGKKPNIAHASNLIDGNSYIFVYTVTGACGSEKTDTLVIDAGLKGFKVTAGGPSDTLCIDKDRSIFAYATGGLGSYTYVWTSSDGSFTTTTIDSIVSVRPINYETIYTVYVKDNLQPGCRTNDATVKVDATKPQNLFIPNLITPNGDGKNDVFFLADKDTKMPMIQEGSHVEIVNRWGSKVFEADNYNNNWIPTDLTDGMYYYHVTSSCGNKEYKSWLQILGNTNN